MVLKLVDQISSIVAHNQQISSLLRDETTLDRVLNELEESIEETGSVEQADGSVMNANLSPGPKSRIRGLNKSGLSL